MKENKKIKKKNTQEYGIWTDQGRRWGEGKVRGKDLQHRPRRLIPETLLRAQFPQHVLGLVMF